MTSIRQRLASSRISPWVAALFAIGLGCNKAPQSPTPTGSPGTEEAGLFKVGIVFDKGGKDDKSFNAAAHRGATDAQKEFKFDYRYVEASDDNAFEPMIRSFAQKKFDLVVGIGFSQADAIGKVGKQFPDVKFVLIDSEVKLPNVRSVMFEEHQGSYLVGALAAIKIKEMKVTGGKAGFVGGMDIPLIRRFAMGYEAGVHAIDPKMPVIANYVGVTGDAWNNPPRAKELALSQIQSGVEVIFGAAGASNAGVFDAVAEKQKFAIGCDSNQNWVRPGRILTSMLKRVDLAVYDAIKSAHAKTFQAGLVKMGLDSSAGAGVDFAIDEHNRALITPEAEKKVNELKAEIIAGKISVPDYYLKK